MESGPASGGGSIQNSHRVRAGLQTSLLLETEHRPGDIRQQRVYGALTIASRKRTGVAFHPVQQIALGYLRTGRQMQYPAQQLTDTAA